MAREAGLAKSSLKYFYNTIWKEAFQLAYPSETFKHSEHTDRWCDELQFHPRTSKESARAHLKSSVIYAHIGWLIFKRDEGFDGLYLSYIQPLAAHHISKAREIIQASPYFTGLIWDSDASGLLECHWDDILVLRYSIIPGGVQTFKRGYHPKYVWCDDILRDPTQRKLNAEQIQFVNRVFAEQITLLPKKEGGVLHVWGTSQDSDDLFAANRKKPAWHCTTERAYDPLTLKTLFPNQYSYQDLMQIKADIGEKAFAKEMMCAPVRGEESYFHETDILQVTNKNLRNLSPEKDSIQERVITVGGLDIGKKRHPSHLVAFKIEQGKLIQIHSKFMDVKDYTTQLEYIGWVQRQFQIADLAWDGTRGEFDLYEEQGKLPYCMVKRKSRIDGGKKVEANENKVIFSQRTKSAMAAAFDRLVSQRKIELLDDERQRKLILSVDNELDAPETALGHGDSFWSVALACMVAEPYLSEHITQPIQSASSSVVANGMPFLIESGSVSVMDGERPGEFTTMDGLGFL